MPKCNYLFDARANTFFLSQLSQLDSSGLQELTKGLTKDDFTRYLHSSFKYMESEFSDKVSVKIISEYKAHSGQLSV